VDGGSILEQLDMNLDSFQRVIYSSSPLTKSLTCSGPDMKMIFQKIHGRERVWGSHGGKAV